MRACACYRSRYRCWSMLAIVVWVRDPFPNPLLCLLFSPQDRVIDAKSRRSMFEQREKGKWFERTAATYPMLSSRSCSPVVNAVIFHLLTVVRCWMTHSTWRRLDWRSWVPSTRRIGATFDSNCERQRRERRYRVCNVSSLPCAFSSLHRVVLDIDSMDVSETNGRSEIRILNLTTEDDPMRRKTNYFYRVLDIKTHTNYLIQIKHL